jgi:hypothetical protein
MVPEAELEQTDAGIAYSHLPSSEPVRYRDGLLPDG